MTGTDPPPAAPSPAGPGRPPRVARRLSPPPRRARSGPASPRRTHRSSSAQYCASPPGSGLLQPAAAALPPRGHGSPPRAPTALSTRGNDADRSPPAAVAAAMLSAAPLRSAPAVTQPQPTGRPLPHAAPGSARIRIEGVGRRRPRTRGGGPGVGAPRGLLLSCKWPPLLTAAAG